MGTFVDPSMMENHYLIKEKNQFHRFYRNHRCLLRPGNPDNAPPNRALKIGGADVACPRLGASLIPFPVLRQLFGHVVRCGNRRGDRHGT